MTWETIRPEVAATAQIECGSAARLEATGEDRILVEPGEDAVPREIQMKGPISCYNVCVALHNEDATARDLTVEVQIPQWLREAGFGDFLRKGYLPAPLETGGGPLPRPAPPWTVIRVRPVSERNQNPASVTGRSKGGRLSI